jgi:hypothetical protein
MTRRIWQAAAGALAAALFMAGAVACGGQAAPANGQSMAVRQAYLQYWQALISANSGPDPGSALLSQHAASTQLALLQHNLAIDVRSGIYAAGTVSHNVRSVTVQGTVAYVVDCVGLDKWLLYSQHTRMPIPQYKDRPSQLAMFTLAKDGRAWKVTRSEGYGNC